MSLKLMISLGVLLSMIFDRPVDAHSADTTLKKGNIEVKYAPYIQDLKEKFSRVKKPKISNMFHTSIKHKKYEVIKENLENFEAYIKKKEALEADVIRAYKILQDKILWIDGFKTGSLNYFSSPLYAEEFFKESDEVFKREAKANKRK